MSSINDLWLRVNYWTLSNIRLLKKWWVILLLALTVFFVVFALTNVIVYVISFQNEQRLIQRMVDSSALYASQRSGLSPVPLEVGKPVILPGSIDAKDIVVSLTNPNGQWMAEEVTYVFVVDGTELEPRTSFVAPNYETYVAIYGQDLPSTNQRREVAVNITDVQWRRFSDQKHALEEIFDVSDVNYYVSREGQPIRMIGAVTAQVKNTTFEGFWQTQFTIVLFANESPIAIHTAFLDQFERLSTRTLSAQWFPAPERVDAVRIIPELNLLDRDNLMSL